MGAPGPTPRVTLEDTLGIFTTNIEPGTPLTAPEVAEWLGCARRTAYRKLEGLAERGDLKTKKVGARSRVWWRPPPLPSAQGNAEITTLGQFGSDGLAIIDAAIFGMAPDGAVVSWNEGAERLFGYRDDEVIDESLSKLFAKATSRDLLASQLSAARKEGHAQDEVWCIRKDAAEFPASIDITAYHDIEGCLSGFTTVIRDLTERVARERALEESERRYRTLIEHFPNGAVSLVDDELRYTVVGGDFQHVALSPSDFDGRTPREVWPNGVGSVLESKYRAALQGETSTFELAHGGRDYRLWTVPVTDGEGRVFAAMGMSQDVTEGVAREQQLEQYETIVETVGEGIYALDDELQFTMVNEAYAAMVGYPRDELIGAHISDVVDEEAVTLATKLRDGLEAGEIDGGTAEVAVPTADGDVIMTETTFAPLWFEPGSLAGTVGVVRDITDRRERERELDRVLDLLAKTERIADVGGWEIDIEPMEVFWTDHVFELLEVPRDEEPRFDEVLDVFHDEDRPVIEEAVQQATETGNSFDIEARFHTPDGELRWIHVQGVPELNDGKVVTLRGAAQDITDRKAHERELAEQRERYRRLVEAAPVGIAIYDADGTIAYINDGAVDLAGAATPDALIGHRAIEFVHPDDRKKAVERMQRVIANRTAVPPKETRIVGLDGEVKHTIITSVPITYEGEPAAQVVLTDITERKERELALQRYKTVFDTVEDGIYILGPDFHFVEVNDAYAEMTGFDRGELIGSPCSIVVGESISTEAATIIREVTNGTDGAATIEADIVTKDGGRIPGESKFTALPSDNGFQGSVGVVRDLTDRMTYERSLRQYESIIEKSADVNAILEADGTIQYVTPSIEHVLGYTPDDVVAMDAFEFIHPDDRAETRALFTGLVQGAEEQSLAEFRFRRTDGEWVWLEARGRNLQDDPTIDGFVIYTRDVTERQIYEQQLESHARQQAVIADLGREALENPDLDELFQAATQRVAETLDTDYCKVLELDCDSQALWLRQGVGWRDGFVGHATVDANDNSQAGFTLRSEAPVIVENLESETRFSGPELLTSHDVRSGISTVIGSVDDPWGVLGTHDTDRRSFTDEDVNFVQSVANVLAEAIERQGYEDELQALVDELAASNERLEQFAYVASHDLQEPLRMVSSYLNLLDRRYTDDLDGDAQDYIEYAVDGADRMREMIDDLLAYARVETQGEPFEPTDCDAVVSRTLTNLGMQIREANAEIETGTLPTVAADGKQLELVFQNLVSNAIKYRGDEPPHIEIDAARDRTGWVFQVADNGIGMDPIHTDRIFEVFKRLHASGEYTGTGIGLALCKRIIDRHGGDIWVETVPGGGSTFYFTIPDVDPPGRPARLAGSRANPRRVR